MEACNTRVIQMKISAIYQLKRLKKYYSTMDWHSLRVTNITKHSNVSRRYPSESVIAIPNCGTTCLWRHSRSISNFTKETIPTKVMFIISKLATHYRIMFAKVKIWSLKGLSLFLRAIKSVLWKIWSRNLKTINLRIANEHF